MKAYFLVAVKDVLQWQTEIMPKRPNASDILWLKIFATKEAGGSFENVGFTHWLIYFRRQEEKK